MKNAAQHTRALNQLLGKLARRVGKRPPPDYRPVELLIFSLLAYDSTHAKAQRAYERLIQHAVDLNDLRVSDPMDLAAMIGPKYPGVADRALRLRAVLNAIYYREHAVDLSSLSQMAKKDVRSYLDSLDGMVPYVSSAVTLLGFGGHAIPLDDQLYRKLLDDGVIEPDATFAETQAFLDHHIRFEDAPTAHQCLRTYVDRGIRFDASDKKAARSKTTSRTKKRAQSRKSSKARR